MPGGLAMGGFPHINITGCLFEQNSGGAPALTGECVHDMIDPTSLIV